MTRNIGAVDRGIRIGIGLLILGLGLAFRSWWGLIGLLPLLTATFGWCPLYVPFGLSTCRLQEGKDVKARA